MNIIDLHCDTLSLLKELNDGSTLKRNNLCVDLEKLKAANVTAQFFALYVDLKKEEKPFAQAVSLLDLFYRQLKENHLEIELAHSWNFALNIKERNKIAAFLTLEEGGALEGKLDNLDALYSLGVRLITLTWNYPNEIGFPHNHGEQIGLTPFGMEVVEKMNEKGIIIDVSHLSDKGFYDVLKLSKKPFVASHSNARSIFSHSRNLSDEMIKALANAGGVIGVNFANVFLGTSPISRIADIVTHIRHIYQTGGIDVLALGSDFDGIEPNLEIEHIGQINKLIEALESANFSGGEIEKICWRNTARVLNEVLR